MKLNKIEKQAYGNILLTYDTFVYDAEGNKIGKGKPHSHLIEVGNKEKLVETVGQQLADAIEAEYWTEEILTQQENIASPA